MIPSRKENFYLDGTTHVQYSFHWLGCPDELLSIWKNPFLDAGFKISDFVNFDLTDDEIGQFNIGANLDIGECRYRISIWDLPDHMRFTSVQDDVLISNSPCIVSRMSKGGKFLDRDLLKILVSCGMSSNEDFINKSMFFLCGNDEVLNILNEIKEMNFFGENLSVDFASPLCQYSRISVKYYGFSIGGKIWVTTGPSFCHSIGKSMSFICVENNVRFWHRKQMSLIVSNVKDLIVRQGATLVKS